LGPSPKGIAALTQALPSLSFYPDGAAHTLRHTVAEKLDVSPDWLIFGNGSDEIIHLLGLTFLSAEDEVIVGDPTFVLYESATTLAGATLVKVPLTRPGFVHDISAMIAAITPRTRMVFLANPHNPTGTVVNRAGVDALLTALPARALLILDEAYGEYAYDSPDHPDFPAAFPYIRAGAPVVGLRTFSKMYGLAGLRVGYGVAQPEIIRLLNQPRSPFNVNLAGQIAATAAIGDDEFVQKSIKANTDGLSQLYKGFRDLGLSYTPSWANFVVVDTRRPCREVFDALLRQGVIVRVGFAGMPTHLRVTVGTQDQNQRFLNALEAVLPHIAEVVPADLPQTEGLR
jgi:histidinol-phosphate aminotransferase